jgi:hypothetical protein
MRARPIPFSAPMVRAILADTKTQTRRVLKCRPQYQLEERDDGKLWPWMYDSDRDADHWMPCPYGQAGDRLWVREAWKVDLNHRFYRADGDPGGPVPWTPSIHMPRWASRITLEVTGVRVERPQDISEADAKAEGVHRCLDGLWSGGAWKHLRRPNCYADPCNAFCDLWASINGPGSWDANPWVWVVEFRRVEA